MRRRRTDPAGRARALQYDLALNGWELGGGSIRFHTRELLARSFALRATPPESMEAKFGGILEAFEYGAPPHGGIALGVDRWAALLTDQTNIREVMAFPKTSSGSDLMLDAPVAASSRRSSPSSASRSRRSGPARALEGPADGRQRRCLSDASAGSATGTARPLVLGRLEDLRRRTLLDDHALVEEDHPVGDRAGEAHLVGDAEHRHARSRRARA